MHYTALPWVGTVGSIFFLYPVISTLAGPSDPNFHHTAI